VDVNAKQGLLKLNRRQISIVEKSTLLSETDIANQQLYFLSAPFASLSLPHKCKYHELLNVDGTKNEDLVHKVSNGRDTLIIEGSPSFGLPYGNYPRLFNIYVNSQIKKTKSNVVELKCSIKELIETFGIKVNGGNTKKRFYEQVMRFINASYRVERKDPVSKVITTLFPEVPIISHTVCEAWMKRGMKEPATIIFKQSYADSIIERAAPFHQEAINGLKGSTFALDLFTWANLRSYTLNISQKKEVVITYKQLSDQMGASYKSNQRQFVVDLKKAYMEIKCFCPELDISFAKGCLIVRASALAVKRIKAPNW